MVFADYKQYTTASEANPFIATLSETNNTYRTTISLLICIGAFYFYDSFIYDWIIKKCAVGNKLVALVGGVFLIILFIKSYKKQTEYVKKQVEKYMKKIGNFIKKLENQTQIPRYSITMQVLMQSSITRMKTGTLGQMVYIY